MRFLFVVCGILLPAFTLGFELATGGCADLLFDPIPSAWHVLLVGLVPPANFLVLLRAVNGFRGSPSWLGPVSGLAIGVSAVYALVFLPLAPLGVLGIILYGLGLLVLPPLLAFGASLYGRTWLRQTAAAGGRGGRRGCGRASLPACSWCWPRKCPAS